jgi:transketolase
MSSGSLGHGLPVACGIAVNGKVRHQSYNTYVLTGDGELDEGSCWEAILFAAQQQLSRLCLIVDYNQIQSLGNVKDICDLSPLADKFRAFNWHVEEIDGHQYDEIAAALAAFEAEQQRPTVIIAHTVKGKGVSYMEGQLLWHYRNPNDEQLKQALEELA